LKFYDGVPFHFDGTRMVRDMHLNKDRLTA